MNTSAIETVGKYKGMGLAILGLPTIAMLGMSVAVSSPMAGGKGKGARAREGLPNVLMITVDGLRRDHVGPGARVRTPNLDWLARQGVWFEEASTASTAEGPPLVAALTGYHPLSVGYVADGVAGSLFAAMTVALHPGGVRSKKGK